MRVRSLISSIGSIIIIMITAIFIIVVTVLSLATLLLRHADGRRSRAHTRQRDEELPTFTIGAFHTRSLDGSRIVGVDSSCWFD